MTKIVLSLNSIPDNELEQFTSNIIAKLTGNAAVPDPRPPLAELTAKLGAYVLALNAQAGAQSAATVATAVKNNARAALEAALSLEAGTVETATDGDPAKIATTGMAVKAAPTHITSMEDVANFSLSAGDGSGELDWQCDPVARAKSYQVQVSVGAAPASWTLVPGSSRSKGTVTGLTGGQTVWVRVQALGPGGLTSAWSTPQAKIVP